jgi:hypothetical protein
MDYTPWPAELNEMLIGLKRGSHQEFDESNMNAGNVRRRPKGLPIPTLSGSVTLNEKEWAALSQLNKAPRSFFRIDDSLLSFISEPEMTKTTMVNSETSRTVKINLLVRTG